MTDPCVHIIDDEEGVRRTLAFALSEVGFATRSYSTAQKFLDVAADLEPGCVVTDVRMPGMSGLELVRRLKALGLGHAVVVMSAFADIGLVVDAMKMGAADVLQKPFKRAALIAAVRAAAEGLRAGEARPTPEAATHRRSLANLTPRQRQILHGIVEGKASKTIARELGISPRTVEAHRAEIRTKTGVTSASELIRVAVTSGFCEP
jgi:two-component system response regulator FixJ